MNIGAHKIFKKTPKIKVLKADKVVKTPIKMQSHIWPIWFCYRFLLDKYSNTKVVTLYVRKQGMKAINKIVGDNINVSAVANTNSSLKLLLNWFIVPPLLGRLCFC